MSAALGLTEKLRSLFFIEMMFFKLIQLFYAGIQLIVATLLRK